MQNITLEAIVDAVADAVASRILSKEQGNRLQPRLLTVAQAGEYLGRTEDAVKHLLADGTLPKVQSDRRVFLDRHDLDRWIEQNKR